VNSYLVDFYLTRMGALPIDYPVSSTIITDSDGKIVIDDQILGTYLACDSTHADIAFSILKIGLSVFPNLVMVFILLE
jgi:hypothetical protein